MGKRVKRRDEKSDSPLFRIKREMVYAEEHYGKNQIIYSRALSKK